MVRVVVIMVEWLLVGVLGRMVKMVIVDSEDKSLIQCCWGTDKQTDIAMRHSTITNAFVIVKRRLFLGHLVDAKQTFFFNLFQKMLLVIHY